MSSRSTSPLRLAHNNASRRSTRSEDRKLHTHPSPPDRPYVKENELATVYKLPSLKELRKIEGDGPVLSPELTRHQLDLHSPVDVLRDVLLPNQTDYLPPSTRIRLAIQNALMLEQSRSTSGAHPTQLPSPATTSSEPSEKAQFPINGELMPHSDFRNALNARARPGAKEIRRIIREQLLRCQRPEEILRVLAVAMQRRELAVEMTRMYESLRRALYRSRNNVSDDAVLRTINIIITRLQVGNIKPAEDLIWLGIKFAARARSLPGMKRYLKAFRDTGQPMPRGLFRSIIAKFSIGARGLGEIRNGRWTRKDLLQVLLGFDGVPPEQAHHLGLFLQRHDWQYLHGWVAVLARCRAADEVYKEWELWLHSPQREKPRRLQVPNKDMTTKTRGDYWFVEQMCFAGDMKRAWSMLDTSGIPFGNCRPTVRSLLLDEVQHATRVDDTMRRELLEKYTNEIRQLEAALGVKWVSAGPGNPGFHITEPNLQDTLEHLADPTFQLAPPDFGYPWEPDAQEQEAQRSEMEAEEEVD